MIKTSSQDWRANSWDPVFVEWLLWMPDLPAAVWHDVLNEICFGATHDGPVNDAEIVALGGASSLTMSILLYRDTMHG